MELSESYQPPRNARMAMMDLYALYAMWYAKGGGQTAYAGGGFERGAPTNELRRKRIENMFEIALRSQAKMLMNLLVFAIPDELTNLFDEHLVDQAAVRNELDGNPALLAKVEKLATIADDRDAFRKAAWLELSIMDFHKLFSLKLWKNPQCDEYGGANWARIMETLGRLVEAYKAGVPKTLMYWVDRMYDLEHNNGSIMSKSIKTRVVTKQDLDYRSEARLEDFIPVTSPVVAAMIPACMAESSDRKVSSIIEEDMTDRNTENLVEFFLESQEKLNPKIFTDP